MAEGLRISWGWNKRRVLALATLALVLVLAEVRRDAGLYLTPGEWSMSSYRQVTAAIEASSSPGDLVLAFTPGYVFESGRCYFPGLTEDVVYRIMNRITPGERSDTMWFPRSGSFRLSLPGHPNSSSRRAAAAWASTSPTSRRKRCKRFTPP